MIFHFTLMVLKMEYITKNIIVIGVVIYLEDMKKPNNF